MGARIAVASSNPHFKGASIRYANVECLQVRRLNLAIVHWPRVFTHIIYVYMNNALHVVIKE